MKMTKEVIVARQMRLAFIKQTFNNGWISESQAKELLASPLSPGNKDTFVDDSKFLFDPNAIANIGVEEES